MTNKLLDSDSVEKTLQVLDEKKKFRDFLWFFSGQQISILGSSIVSFVLIWWLTETTNSELMLGLASLCSLGPFLLVAPFSGVLADRVKRKPLLLSVDALQALFTVILTIIFMIYYVPNDADPTNIPNKSLLITCVFITLGLRGAMQAFHSPIVSAMTPTMVPAKHLSRLNGAGFLINGIINVLGPAIGALLLNLMDLGLTMWFDAITFVIAVIPLILIKIPSPKQVAREQQPKFLVQFREGLDALKAIKGLPPLIILATVLNFFGSPTGTLMPLFVSDTHLGTKENYALVIGLLQAGMIVGGFFMTFFKGFKKKIRTIIICIILQSIGIGLLITVPPTLDARFWVIGILLFTSMLTAPMINATFGTTLQVVVPNDKMGRISSVVSFLAMAIYPIGTFLSGLIGEFVPHAVIFTVANVLGIIIALIFYFFTAIRKLDVVYNQKIALMEKDKEKETQTDGDILFEAFSEEDSLIYSIPFIESINPEEIE
ncbi:MAG: MFS transporter [Asgard group archaeon]|nr:MFS transporter [Asgard group archaeon]